MKQHDLVIWAIDNPPQASHRRYSSAIVIINVLDQENNAPKFQQSSYNVTMSEVSAVGAVVAEVRAVDLDPSSKITYAIVSSADSHFFDINSARYVITRC